MQQKRKELFQACLLTYNYRARFFSNIALLKRFTGQWF
jgi:hypothetical protein